MFTAKDIVIDSVTKEYILSKITEYDIFKYYCSNFQELNKSFKSELYDDKNPGCRIYEKNNGTLRYKDFGESEHYFDCFNYVMRKYNLTFKECLNVIANDFKLKNNIQIDFNPRFLLSNDISPELKNKSSKAFISIVKRNWNIIDYKYWYEQYCIPFELLEEYNVIPCSYVYLTTNKGKQIVLKEENNNPIYAYKFINYKQYTYKIYRPLAERQFKWLFSGNSSDIEGYDQLPLINDILILTKSLKDCICFNLIGYPAISLQGEANKLNEELVYKLLKRFDDIIICYDNDEEGIKNANKLHNKYKFRILNIEEAKDLSDLIKLKGLDYSKNYINNTINEIR